MDSNEGISPRSKQRKNKTVKFEVTEDSPTKEPLKGKPAVQVLPPPPHKNVAAAAADDNKSESGVSDGSVSPPPTEKKPANQNQAEKQPQQIGTNFEDRRNKNNTNMEKSDRDIELSKWKKGVKAVDTIAASCAGLINALSYLENEHLANIEYVSDSECTGYRVGIMIVIIFLEICVVAHYLVELKVLKLKRLRSEEDNLYTAGRVPWLCAEIVVCGFFVPPGYDSNMGGRLLDGSYSYAFDTIGTIAHMIKCYWILRLFQLYSDWAGDRAMMLCKKYKCEPTLGFAVKAELKRRPYLMVILLMGGTIISLGYMMRQFERTYHPDNTAVDQSSWWTFVLNGLWILIVTMTTVGFGEAYPTTHLGRVIGFLACIIGMLLMSLMVVALTAQSEFTPSEAKAFEVLQRIDANDNALAKAGNVVRYVFKLKKAIKETHTKDDIVRRFLLVTDLAKACNIYSNENRIAKSHTLPVDEMLQQLQKKFEADISSLSGHVHQIALLETQCRSLQDRSLQAMEKIKEITSIQKLMVDKILNDYNRNVDKRKAEEAGVGLGATTMKTGQFAR